MHIIISDCIVQSSTAPPNDTAIPAASRRGNPSCSSQPPSSARRIGPVLTSIAAVPALPPHRIDYKNGLQSFGDWVLAALEQHADGAAEAARCMITALRERDWEGDDVLADQFDALLGGGLTPDLRPLPVDLDELAGVLEGDPTYGGGRVDLATGEVWPALAVDSAREIGRGATVHRCCQL